jgi:hypothetical protein
MRTRLQDYEVSKDKPSKNDTKVRWPFRCNLNRGYAQYDVTIGLVSPINIFVV